jgi:hypothetical protein
MTKHGLPARIRFMRIGIVLIIAGALLFVATIPSSAWLLRGQRITTTTGKTEDGVLISGRKSIKEQYDLTPINTLILETFSGSIEIEISDSMSSIGEFEIKRVSGFYSGGQQTIPSFERIGTTLKVRAEQPQSCQNCTVNYVVKLGKAMRLELRNANGDIDLTGLTNQLVSNTTNGNIRVSNTGRTILDLSSHNGEIILENTPLIAGSQSRLKTINGGVQISQLEQGSGLEIRGRIANGLLDNQRDDLIVQNTESNDFQASLSGANPAKLEVQVENGDLTLE